MRRFDVQADGLAALLGVLCASGTAVAQGADLVHSLDECACPGLDADEDGLLDQCEEELVAAFAPTLIFAPGESEGTRAQRLYWSVHPNRAGRIRIFYALSYLEDFGTVALSLASHEGDAEFVVVDVENEGRSWSVERVFLSAHFGAHLTGSLSRWWDTQQLSWAEQAPASVEVFVSQNKHANYPSVDTCADSGIALDVCGEGDALQLAPLPSRKLGTLGNRLVDEARADIRGGDRCALDCRSEWYWTDQRFCGWQVSLGASRSDCAPEQNSYSRQMAAFDMHMSVDLMRGAACPDGGPASDAGAEFDAGFAMDAGPDAASGAGDASTGAMDGGMLDSGLGDTGGGTSDATQGDAGGPDAWVAVDTCGPADSPNRFEFGGAGMPDDPFAYVPPEDLVYDTVTGLMWRRAQEIELPGDDFPPCEYDPSNVIPRDTPYCCSNLARLPDGGLTTYYPGCNWIGFKALCEGHGMRLATEEELLEFGRASAPCINDFWSSWSAETGPSTAAYVQTLGGVGSSQRMIPETSVIWYDNDHVRCVRGPN